MEVATGVRRLGSRFINFYLIEAGGRLTLLDAGLGGYWNGLIQELVTMDRRIEDIDAILITHHHADHVGVAERVRRAASADAYAHPADSPVISGSRPTSTPNFLAQGWHPYLFRYLFHAILAGVTRQAHVADLKTFADGEVLDVPGRPRVIHVPGHTAGSCALLLESREVLFSGDALVTIELLSGKPGPSLLPDFVNEDSREAAESLARLEPLEAKIMLPGHGEPWRGGVREAVSLARRSLPSM